MTEREKQYFEALSKDRAESANTLEKPSLRNIKERVAEKYTDQAHFIYELLQNADDAGATSARFDLRKNELVFVHNGTKRFSVSDPANEDDDTKEGKLGDINSITSIANSSNTNASIARIGKFGVGFKAVFQYTSTPSIYDPDIFFKIERFIVPVEIDNDFNGRKNDETLFVFPFDHKVRTAAEAFDDISEKLRSLIFPVLFLTNLKEISFNYSSVNGTYTKAIEKERRFENTNAKLINLIQKVGEETHNSRLWLFSRTNGNNYTYSIGFFLDNENMLSPKDYWAFCFFPTREVTGLKFILHAPFLLNDGREGIIAGEQHNKDMIKQLAELASDCLVYLRDIGKDSAKLLINDDIFDIIPYDESAFNDVNDKNKISFKPFYTAIHEKLCSEELLPCKDGYATSDNAYWASVPQIAEVFSNKQLSALINEISVKWVFVSLGRDEILRKNKALVDYIDSITHVWLNDDDMLKGWSFTGDPTIIGGVSSAFIETQSIEWLHSFYKWVSEAKSRTDLIKEKPIFLNQDGKAVAAFDTRGKVILFLPTDTSGSYETIHPELLKNEETADFIKKLGIEEPSLRDEIYNVIMPQYEGSNKVDTIMHFNKFFKYYKECPNEEKDDYIDLIKDCAFVRCRSISDDVVYRCVAKSLYLPTKELRQYFKAKPTTRFVELDEYKKLVGKTGEKFLESFFSELGVKNEPSVFERELSWQEANQIKATWSYSTGGRKWIEYCLDGCKEIVEAIIDVLDKSLSVVLWNSLITVIKSRCTSWRHLDSILGGNYSYFYYSSKQESFDSSEIIRLRTKPWLLNSDGEFVSASELTVQTLSPEYDIQSVEAQELLRFLNIREEVIANEEEAEDSNLTDEQRAKIEFADAYADVPPEVLQQAAEQYRAKKGRTETDDTENIDPDFYEDDEDVPLRPALARVVKELAKRAVSKHPPEESDSADSSSDADGSDEDDYTKPPIDYSKKIAQAKQRSADEIGKIARLEELTQRAAECDKYTFVWFKTLLELESLNSSESNSNSREISISFAKVERESGTTRTLILKHPNRYIPQSMEDLADIPLELRFANHPSVKVAVEVVNVKSYTLRAKLKTGAQIDGINLSLVTEARIEAKNPVFLIEELRKAFSNLGFDDNYNLQTSLCENIEFVFGPPGTGKTTHLARNVILPIVQDEADLQVLVLTPTNKAADVLTRRIMEIMGTDLSYQNWLVRFGTTNDSVIEQSGVYRDKTFDIRAFPRNVTVTTIARFPYDYFIPDEVTRLHLSALKWDYIVIDEASMIPIANIVYPLYKKAPQKFIIAGDPFQIEPIASVDLWKDENIYTMVKLDSFTNPKTTPHDYPVTLLTTQYRSVPEIGEVFSNFAYGGVLLHNRATESQKPLMISDVFDVKSLNIIKFPVSKYESIYRPKRLHGTSSYQVYSALFVFEFAKWLSSLINTAQKSAFFRIGIITPYRAQADLIDKLFSSVSIPKNIDIQVGTIHGFQGDECDIVIAVFNPPPSISASREMFLNKRNIINVSISRARDYLFVVMPDDETDNVENLRLVKKVETLCKKQSSCDEISSNDIEQIIFGSNRYLEDNSFSTSHQQVNVYGEPERRYEVRSEDTAVDVQVHQPEGEDNNGH